MIGCFAVATFCTAPFMIGKGVVRKDLTLALRRLTAEESTFTTHQRRLKKDTIAHTDILAGIQTEDI